MRPAYCESSSRWSSFQTHTAGRRKRSGTPSSSQRQQELAAAMQQLQAAQEVPGPEASRCPADDRLAACRDLRGQSERASARLRTYPRPKPKPNSGHLLARRRSCNRTRINSDTVAIDFARPSGYRYAHLQVRTGAQTATAVSWRTRGRLTLEGKVCHGDASQLLNWRDVAKKQQAGIGRARTVSDCQIGEVWLVRA